MNFKNSLRSNYDTGGTGGLPPQLPRTRKTLSTLFLSVVGLISILEQPTLTRSQSVTPLLFGVGYYETQGITGVNYASLAGGAEIIFQGQGMSHNPSCLSVIFNNPSMNFQSAGPPLSQDNQFRSDTDSGKLDYTVPSAMKLHSVSYDQLAGYDSLTYGLSLLNVDDSTYLLQCGASTLSNCYLTLSRAYTPILYYLQPPVVYYQSKVGFWVDPRSTQNLKQVDDLPFIDGRINGYTIDFSQYVDEATVLSAYNLNQVLGNVGQIGPNASTDANLLFEAGNSLYYDSTMLRCDYTNTTCYRAKSVPVINYIDNLDGYTTGSQTINIQGWGFNSPNISVKIDDQPCIVQKYSVDQFSCVTSPNPNPSNNTYYIGQKGLRRRVFNSSAPLNLNTILTTEGYSEMLSMDLEPPTNEKDGYYGNVLTGYFKAPATANYRFYMSCDDACILSFSNVTMSPINKTRIFSLGSYTGYRNYITIDDSMTSQWINLTQGEYYYIEALQVNYGGAEHLTVSVEIEDPNIVPGHQHTSKQIQRLQIDQAITREQSIITVVNPDGNRFIVNFQNPLNNQLWASQQISTNASADAVAGAIRGFYSLVWGAPIQVTKAMYLSNGSLTLNQLLSVRNVFTISVLRSIPQASTNYVNFQKVTTKSTLQFKLPRDTQLSNVPIKGFFAITCILPDGTPNTTLQIPVKSSPNQISGFIDKACPNYKEKYEIWDGPAYRYYEDGRDIFLRFIGTRLETPQMTIAPFTGNPLVGVNVSVNSTIVRQYDPHRIFYEPVPFDFVYTNEQQAQIIITVDGLEAVCASLECGFNYHAPSAQITGFSYDGVQTLIIQGQQFSAQSDLVSLTLGGQVCSITSSSATQITCTIVPIAGVWQPVLIDTKGLVPVTATNQLTIPLIVTSVTPNSNINPKGGTLLTVVGNNFPSVDPSHSRLQVTFSDGSLCQVQSLSITQFTCLTGPFKSGIASSTMTVQVGNQQDSSQSVMMAGISPKVTDIVPNMASPVLKSLLTINLTNIGFTLTKDDLSVMLIDQQDPTNVRHLNIVKIDNTNGHQYLQVKYGGAYSGLYNVNVSSLIHGCFDSEGITLQAVGKVTDFNPKQGSVNGGTLITITGYNFSTTDITDNNVRIGYTDCLVQSTSNNEITCLTIPRMEGVGGQDDLIVFLKVSEEAVMDVSPIYFTWIDDPSIIPEVTNYTLNFDSNLQDWVLSIFGAGFGTDTANTQLFIDGKKQTILAQTDSQVDVQITSMLGSNTANIQFYLPIGTPFGTDNLTTVGITLTPMIVSITPSNGSPAGSIIQASVRGVGPNTQGVNLVDQNGNSVCQKVQIPSYGQVLCQTKVANVASQSLSVKIGTTSSSCVGATGACNYQTITSMPSISNVAMPDASTFIFTGLGFTTLSGFNPFVSFQGILATNVVINSDISIAATFTNGVPIAQTAQKPQLYFESSTSKISHWAQSNSTISNTLTATSIQSAVQCSFAGGCQMTLAQSGVYSSLQSTVSLNSLTVCGQPCKPIASASSASSLTCSLPPLATTYSVLNYNVTQEAYIKGTPFSSVPQLTIQMFDGVSQNGWTDSKANCSFGTAFKSGYLGVLSEVKYFMNRFAISKIANKFRFQGSMDNVTFTDIFLVGLEIHEGWNYYNFARGNELRYRFYRFFGNDTGSCLSVGEVGFRGIEVIDSNAPSYSSCPIQLNLDNQASVTLGGSITYTSTLTPLLTSISPRYGTVKGGDTITFKGSNFPTNTALYTILIDTQPCTVTSASATQVRCTTAPRPGLYSTSNLDMKISGMGSVATQGLVYRYCNMWSDETTWGGEFAPIAGDMVYVPTGLNLCVDVDSTPVLSAVLVEGTIIFPDHQTDPNYLKTFDAEYIFVNGGYMEVGTEQFPYKSKLTITMHSNKQSPEIPIYGNKVIGVRNGILDMHGIARNPVWTSLDSTAQIGDTSISIIQSVDWQAGEVIVIAPTGYDNKEAEERIISAIDRTNPNKPIVSFTQPLNFKHFSGIQTLSSTDFIEMRAEVALLTRNVVFRGDPETSAANQFGAHIMLHSMGDESSIGRIEYIELRDVGQAFQLGRYPIHFHRIGTVHNSYVNGNAIHHTYNRAVTIHAVHYLRITNNVAYKTMGHTFFIEDAIETKNYLENNLAILTQQSWSLLNTDQSPASFWITNPDNIFRGNHAAGATFYGFWFDTKTHPTGPSFDPNICPENSQLGEFTNNVAHSNGRYGLRIFHNLMPRTNPCSPIIFDVNPNVTDPYWQNPLITAHFINFTSFKNGRNGAIAEKVGDVRFENFKVADNLIAGIEFSLTDVTMDGTAQINKAIVIGRSDNAEDRTNNTFSHGIITPRYDNFQVHNVSFYGFDVGGKAAIGSCSHCFHPASTDSGARTVTFSGLKFDTTVTTKIKYQFPFRDIFYDLDGTLTGLGPKSWATPYWRHNEQRECIVDEPIFNGILCNSSVQVRRLAFHQQSPSNIFNLMDMKILKIDGTEYNSTNDTDVQTYFNDSTNYANVQFKPKKDPSNGWAIPFVTNHKYKIHWGYGLDFISMRMDQSQKWTPSDLGINLVFNFSDVRARVDVITAGDTIPNMTLTNKTLAKEQLQLGDNVIYNDTSVREIHLHVNAKNTSRNSVKIVGYRCNGPCISAIEDQPLETRVRFWSDPTSWDTGVLPKEGQDVIIPSGQNFIFDLDVSPLYNYIEIQGQVAFDNTKISQHLRAKYIFVRSGSLIIGTETNRYLGNALITLSGEMSSQNIVFNNAIEAGNKILANTASVKMFGAQKSSISRLLATANSQTNTLQVSPGLDWVQGDKLGILPTNMRFWESDYAIISSYDPVSGLIVLDRQLSFTHYGAAKSTAFQYNGADIRGEVVLLSRNIKIIGNDTEAWGCQFLTSNFFEANGVFRTGNTILDNVEIYNCSQYDTMKAALRFEGNINSGSSVSNSVLHHGLGIGVQIVSSDTVELSKNVLFDFVKFGINIESSSSIFIDSNIVSNIKSRNIVGLDKAIDPIGGIMGCALIEGDYCTNLRITNNIVAGTLMAGYSAPGHQCGVYNPPLFKNNIAHSIEGVGAIIYKNPADSTSDQCIEGSFFTAYKCTETGAVTYSKTQQAIFTNMTLIDNIVGVAINIGQEGDNLKAQMYNSVFYGETESRDCDVQNQCKSRSGAMCGNRTAIMISQYSQGGKRPMFKTSMDIPYWKIKSDGSYGGDTYYQNNQFIGYSSKTYCGNSQNVISLNPTAADYMPRAKFYNTVFNNIDQDALAYLYSPPWSWANTDDCGIFPCTAPNNQLIQFQRTSFTGTVRPFVSDSAFQIVPNNPSNVQGFSNCKQMPSWNAYYCTNDYLGVLLFESLDSDKYMRMVSPIDLISYNTTSKNTLNTFMDHVWDGFYTGHLRLSRWPALLQTGNNIFYEIQYTGTAPTSQRFRLISDMGGVTLRIRFTKPGAYVVNDQNGNLIKHNDWDRNLKQPGLIQGPKKGLCGENRYVGVVNILDFYITPGCNLQIKQIDSIYASVRMNWTLDGFYASGGTTKFVDRLAASLGIHASNIKVVSVYTGSVVVGFQIVDDPTNPLNNTMGGSLSGVQALLNTKLANSQISLGAPIIGADIIGIPVTLGGANQTTAAPVINYYPTTIPGQNITIQPTQQQTTPPIVVAQNGSIVVNTVTQEAETPVSGINGVMIGVICGAIIGVIILSITTWICYKRFLNKQSVSLTAPEDAKQVANHSISAGQSLQFSPGGMSEVYEEQYHPKAEIGNIFGHEDPIKKMNQADHIIQEEEEEDDENVGKNKQFLPTEEEDNNYHTNAPMQDGTNLQEIGTMKGGVQLNNKNLFVKKNSGRSPSMRFDEEKGPQFDNKAAF